MSLISQCLKSASLVALRACADLSHLLSPESLSSDCRWGGGAAEAVMLGGDGQLKCTYRVIKSTVVGVEVRKGGGGGEGCVIRVLRGATA